MTSSTSGAATGTDPIAHALENQFGLADRVVDPASLENSVARFRETSRGHIMGLSTGFMKMIFSLETRRLLGVHIVGEGATELIHIGQAVLNLEGTLDYFVQNTFNYPTLAEAYKIAALDAWNRVPKQQPSARVTTIALEAARRIAG